MNTPLLGSPEWFRLIQSARAQCPKCKKEGLGYASHPHALGYKDYGRLKCRYCRSRFKNPTLEGTATPRQPDAPDLPAAPDSLEVAPPRIELGSSV